MNNDVLDGPTAPAEDAAVRADDAKARRAARKAARAAIPPPERDHAYDHFGLDQLRELRGLLGDEETRAAYWRRIMAGSLEAVRAGAAHREPVADLRGAARGGQRRGTARPPGPSARGLTVPLPDLAELWGRRVDTADELAAARLVADLGRRRGARHVPGPGRRARGERHHELIARYREQPLLALQTLPGDPLGRPSCPDALPAGPWPSRRGASGGTRSRTRVTVRSSPRMRQTVHAAGAPAGGDGSRAAHTRVLQGGPEWTTCS